MTDSTTPEGLGWEHGAHAAELATLEDSPVQLTDDEIVAYFPGADRTDTLVAYRDAWSEAFQTYAEAVRDLRCESCDFPAGYRTGTINAYRYAGPAVENAAPGCTYQLCDDCVRHAAATFGTPLVRIEAGR